MTALEQIMLKFVELCVQMRKGKTAKEGLHQYKNMQQNSNITTIEVGVMRRQEQDEEEEPIDKSSAMQILAHTQSMHRWSSRNSLI